LNFSAPAQKLSGTKIAAFWISANDPETGDVAGS
jgi:hypothetical protein